MAETVGQRATKSVKWSALIEVVSRVAPSITILILARLLTPSDFGVVATATIVINFCQVFRDAGLGQALVQTRETLENAADIVFWTNVALGILAYGVLLLAAPAIATFFSSPISLPVLRVLGLQVLIGSLASVQQALFVRDLDFRRLFWAKLAAAAAPGVVSIPLALFGFGVWALVAGTLAGSLVNLALVWQKSPWRPHATYDWRLARRLFGFGAWVIGEGLTAWFFGWGDNLLVGRFLGVDALGTYSLGWSVTSLIFGLLLSPFSPVLYSTLSRLQGDPAAVKATFHKAIRIMSAVSLPAGMGFLLSGSLVATVFLGEQWHGLGFVLSIIGFSYGFMGLLAVNPETYRAMGRPDINAKLQFAFMLFYLPVYLWVGPLGLEPFTLARMSLGLVTIFVHLAFSVRMLGVSPFYMWHASRPAILATIAMGAIVALLRGALTQSSLAIPQIVQLGLLVACGGIAYIAILWLVDRSFISQTKNTLLHAVLAREA